MIVLEKTLYGVTRKDKTKEWYIKVTDIGGEGVIYTSHAIVGNSRVGHVRIINKGKNIGKANETTPVQQALKEAQSKIQKKLDERYRETPKEAFAASKEVFRPMLAVSWDKQHKKIKYPCFAQPKLDGVRCIASKKDGKIFLQSRGGKAIDTLDHIEDELNLLLKDGEVLDGEIYRHGWSFQKIVSAVKKVNNDTKWLEYHVYDLPSDKDRDFLLRSERLFIIMSRGFIDPTNMFEVQFVEPVRTREIADIHELDAFEAKMVELGYEGVMVRNASGRYMQGHRSYDLQKMKRFEDAEYSIVDVVEGTGIETGCAIFVCATKDGQEFRVRPTGTHEQREAWFKMKSSLIDRELTVKFQGLTDDGLPRFPVGLHLREDWDK